MNIDEHKKQKKDSLDIENMEIYGSIDYSMSGVNSILNDANIVFKHMPFTENDQEELFVNEWSVPIQEMNENNDPEDYFNDYLDDYFDDLRDLK